MKFSGMENIIYNPSSVEKALTLLMESKGEYLDVEYKIMHIIDNLQKLNDDQMNKKVDIVLKEVDLKKSLYNSEEILDDTVYSLERIVIRLEEYIREGKEPIWSEVLLPLKPDQPTSPTQPVAPVNPVQPTPDNPQTPPSEPITPPDQQTNPSQPASNNPSATPVAPATPSSPISAAANQTGPNGETPPTPPSEPESLDSMISLGNSNDEALPLAQTPPSRPLDAPNERMQKNKVAVAGTVGAVGAVGAGAAIIYNKKKKNNAEENSDDILGITEFEQTEESQDEKFDARKDIFA